MSVMFLAKNSAVKAGHATPVLVSRCIRYKRMFKIYHHQ